MPIAGQSAGAVTGCPWPAPVVVKSSAPRASGSADAAAAPENVAAEARSLVTAAAPRSSGRVARPHSSMPTPSSQEELDAMLLQGAEILAIQAQDEDAQRRALVSCALCQVGFTGCA